MISARKFTSILLLILLAGSVRGQINTLLSSSRGMPNSLVNSITEDANGHMWIATENGLTRFDGSRFTNYYNIKGNKNTLVSNFVRTLCSDKSGSILVGTTNGLQIYYPHSNSFSEVITNKTVDFRNNNINHISPLSDGGYLVTGQTAYSVYPNKDGQTEVRKNALTHKVNNIICGIQARDGSLWVIQRPGGIYKTEGKTDKLSHITDNLGRDYNFQTLCQGQDGRIYAAHAEAGMYVYDARTRHFNLVQGTEKMLQIRDIQPLRDGNTLCIGTDGSGVILFDIKTHKIKTNTFLDDPFLNMSSQKVHCIHLNRNGDIWLGLYQKGIYIAGSQQDKFEYIGEHSPKKDLIGDRCVTGITQVSNGDVWVTTDNGGLYGITPDYKQCGRYVADGSANSVPSTMLGLFEDSRHRVWFGSFNHGSGTVNLTTGKCDYVPLKGADGHLYSIYEFAEDKRGNIWAASMGNGIVRYDEKSNTFSTYTSSGGTSWSTSIMYDKQHDVFYVGTYGGIVWFSPNDTKKTIHSIVSCTAANAISRVSSSLLAFSTTDGLILYDTGKKTITKTITKENGLANSNVLSAKSGNDGHLWISTSEGLVRFDMKTMTAETYTSRDGLQSNEFYKNSSMVGRDGRLWFGGTNGITVFSPKSFSDLSQRSAVKINVVSLRAEEQYIMPNEDGEYHLTNAVNAFTVELAALPLYMTHRITYSYQMDGGKWETLPFPQNLLTYQNIGYGEHVLCLKTVIDDKESETTRTIIYVPYPWYLKWWVVMIWMLFIAGVAYWAHINVKRRRYLHNAVLEHQREEELKETKLQFFMNIVHDLRTPLTLISAPLQKLSSMGDDEKHQRLYAIMSKNADRLLRLSNEIMDLRKIDRGKMELHCHHISVTTVIESIVYHMSDIAETRKLELKAIDNTDGDMHAWLDVESIEKILTNLISNAIKFTEPGGYVHVTWNTDAEARLCITVTDTGIGIPEEAKEHIFDRFYQVKSTEKHIKGTGIGLNLVKSLVELHHGEIIVNDNPEGHGTQFTIILPTNKEAYRDDELSYEEIQQNVGLLTETSIIDDILDIDNEDKEANEDRQDCVTREASKPQSQGKRKTILVADDDDDIRQFLCEEFAVQYNVVTAPEGKAAHDIILKQHIDLLVSDVMMPNIDGIELCRLVRQNVHKCNLPIILLTAKNSDQDQLEGLQSKADAYVTKPFNIELLQTMVCNLLMRQDSLRNSIKGFEMTTEKITTPSSTSADDKLMERLVKVIDANLNNPDLTSDLLAREVGLSRVHLYRKLKVLTNQSATTYIRNIRLTKAAELLREKHLTVSETAYLVGFRTPNHFSTAFKELYGVSPKEYANGSST